jgi:hypothetical protein
MRLDDEERGREGKEGRPHLAHVGQRPHDPDRVALGPVVRL